MIGVFLHQNLRKIPDLGPRRPIFFIRSSSEYGELSFCSVLDRKTSEAPSMGAIPFPVGEFLIENE